MTEETQETEDTSEPSRTGEAQWPGETQRPSGIQAFTWGLWPWLNWLLPIFFCFHGLLLDNNGWEQALWLALFSPIIVPVLGLLGSLPRFILRVRGHSTAPGPMIFVLYITWWSGFIGSLIGAPLSDDQQTGILTLCVLAVAVSWVVLLTLSAILEPGPAGGALLWRRTSWIAAFAVPVVFALTFVAVVLLPAAQATDAASETSAQAQSRLHAEQIELAQDRYESLQEDASEVRALIAEDGWRTTGEALDYPASQCLDEQEPCYEIQVSSEIAADGIGASELTAELESLGWTPGRDDAWHAAGGRTLWIGEHEGVMRVNITSPWWWGDARYVVRDSGEHEEGDEVYAADEWPPL